MFSPWEVYRTFVPFTRSSRCRKFFSMRCFSPWDAFLQEMSFSSLCERFLNSTRTTFFAIVCFYPLMPLLNGMAGLPFMLSHSPSLLVRWISNSCRMSQRITQDANAIQFTRYVVYWIKYVCICMQGKVRCEQDITCASLMYRLAWRLRSRKKKKKKTKKVHWKER